MRKIKDVLRLKLDAGLSHQQIAAAAELQRPVGYLDPADLVGGRDGHARGCARLRHELLRSGLYAGSCRRLQRQRVHPVLALPRLDGGVPFRQRHVG